MSFIYVCPDGLNGRDFSGKDMRYWGAGVLQWLACSLANWVVKG